MEKFKVQFVCLGNICRSPLAHAVFQRYVDDAGLHDVIEIESSGTGAWHVGQLPDRRMAEEASNSNYRMDHLARRFSLSDLEEWDMVLAMDGTNQIDILRIAESDEQKDKVQLFREFDPVQDGLEVPDPYYGGQSGFTTVFDIVERTSKALLEYIIANKLKK